MFVTDLYKVYMLSGHSAAQKKSIYERLPVILLNLKSSILRQVSVCPRSPTKAVLFLSSIWVQLS